ncbi:glycosyltransferase involved in cell wall biosynthesis [Streptosporangium becharense]|uniref:Glycosyltransferase involved in cell wall biosynthesis n=1 Tax=Streptosporangium becharense TaxID=1816182 RepID=A0A7W9IJC5_9ACTN|nr:glycosyltransferase family 4 protein [Streptosporangium becharense]MBB2911133.1 glycosyltransferase involved in cell wall biosynthesis [Streptosporangium becharense]MBB5821809.1 glycosyltransferase involved in cell wall biosynthesis [Streptosporangium becharense]
MRILHVSDCYLPRLGGIEVQVADLIRTQRQAGHQVEVATATPGEPLPGVHRIVAKLPFDLPVHPFGVRHMLRLMTARRPDVVHVHTGAVSPFAWMGVRAAVRAGLPVVVTVHSMWDPVTRAIYRGLRAAYGWQRWGLVGTAVSEAAARPIRAVAGPGVPVHVVSNGLDVSAWRPAADPAWHGADAEGNGADSGGRRSGEEPVHVVAVGRLAPRKQPVRLLRLLKEARARVPGDRPMRATVVGDGPARAQMERYLRANGMTGWVSLPGRYDRDRIRELLVSADVFVAPAPRESFGLAALEARSAGVPVVARAQSGVADFVRQGKEGLLGRSFDDLVASVARLVRDRELRESIAAHNRETEPVRSSWPAVLEGFERCYEEARAIRTRRTPGT